jgi:hypothetical protein
MKITMYELLGLIKDGKAPKEIKYENFVYSWVRKYKTYTRYDIPGKDLYITTNNLNDEVEIIEENKKIEHCKGYEDFGCVDELIEHLREKIDILIDEINKMKEGKK